MIGKMEQAARKYWIGCSGLRTRIEVDHDTSARLLHESLASPVVRPHALRAIKEFNLNGTKCMETTETA